MNFLGISEKLLSFPSRSPQQVKQYKQEQEKQMHPLKFDMCEDVSSLTYLNDASVIWNLKPRYVEKLI